MVSLIALATNAALAIYQFRKIKRQNLNPLRDELYTDSKRYKQVEEENR